MKKFLAVAFACLLPGAAFAIDYVNAEVSAQDMSRMDLKKSEFVNATVTKSSFAGANLEGASFSNTTFSSGSMKGANLRGSTCTNSEFAGIDIRGADFSGASFVNCDLSGAISDKTTNFDNVNISNSELPGSASAGHKAAGNTITSTTVASNIVTSSSAGNTAVVSTPAGGPMDIVVNTGGVNVDLRNPGMHIKVGDGSSTTQVTRVTTPGSNIVVSQSAPREYKDERAIAAALEKPNSRVDLTVNFEFDSDKILAEGHKQVYAIAQALKNPSLAGKSIRIEGHTDSKGTDAYNVDLSYRRAVSVLDELSKKYDVDTHALTVKGFGESQPVADNSTDDGRALNRRVTLVRM